jgi:RNA polymerase sigma factor (TIGR02999 family)
MSTAPVSGLKGAGEFDLSAIARSAPEWFELLYGELRRMARGELFRHQALTMGPTTLLHEAWLRLLPSELKFASQEDLIRYTAHVMRGIVVDHIRSRASLKRGGNFDIVAYETLSDLRDMGSEEALKINEAMQELCAIDAGLAELVELKFFGGLTFVEIAALRKVSERTVQRDWNKARLLLYSAVNR